jgi:hypothetical protein
LPFALILMIRSGTKLFSPWAIKRGLAPQPQRRLCGA